MYYTTYGFVMNEAGSYIMCKSGLKGGRRSKGVLMGHQQHMLFCIAR